MAAGNTRVDRVNPATRHQFGFFHRTLYRLDRGFDIDHHATLEPAGGMGTDTHHLNGPVHFALADDRNHFRGSDIEADNHVFRFNR